MTNRFFRPTKCSVSHLHCTMLLGGVLAVSACQSAPQTSNRPRVTNSNDAAAAANQDASTGPVDQGIAGNSMDATSQPSVDSGVSLDAQALADAQTGTPDSGVLFGERPSSPLSVPSFMAQNYDGAQRGQADLIGQPTVVWFFPFEGTPG